MVELTHYDRARMDALEEEESVVSEDSSLIVGRLKTFFLVSNLFPEPDKRLIIAEFALDVAKEEIEEFFNERKWEKPQVK
jgi:hypothetical protein